MTIRTTCPCGKTMVFPDAYEGRTLACKGCGSTLKVSGEKIPVAAPRRRRPVLLILFLLIIPACFVAGFFYSRRPRFTSAADEYRDGSKSPIDAKVDGPRIERVFAALAAASKEGNEEAFVGCFHLRRMLAEIELRGALQTVTRRRDEQSLQGELGGTMRDLCDQMKNRFGAWQLVLRCGIRFLEGRGEAEAAVTMKTEDHLDRYRFWLIKENDAWEIFDYESLQTGFRMSAHNGRMLVRQAKGEVSSHDLEKVAALMDKARDFHVRNQPDRALEALAQADAPAAAAGQQSSVELLRAQVLLQLQKPAEALARIDESLKLQKDSPPAIQLRALILHALGRYDDAVRAQQDYMLLAGDDADAHFWIGKAYEELGRREDALKAYRKGAACDEFDAANRKRLQELEQFKQ